MYILNDLSPYKKTSWILTEVFIQLRPACTICKFLTVDGTKPWMLINFLSTWLLQLPSLSPPLCSLVKQHEMVKHTVLEFILRAHHVPTFPHRLHWIIKQNITQHLSLCYSLQSGSRTPRVSDLTPANNFDSSADAFPTFQK